MRHRVNCINLLPWREELREQDKKQFLIAMLLAAVGTLLVIFLSYCVLSYKIQSQVDRNDFLKQEIVILDKHNAEIRELKQKKNLLIKKMSVIQSLQLNRPVVIHLFDEMVKVLPAGILLKQMDWNNGRVNLFGTAESNSYVSTLMRNIESASWLVSPELIEIKSPEGAQGDEKIFRLSMGIKLNNQQGS